MAKYFNIIQIALIASIFLCTVVQLPNNRVHAESDPVEYWAVIIGVADYQYFESPPLFPKPAKGYDLLYSDDDAINLADQLGSIWGTDHIKLLVDSQANKAGIQNAITNWLDPKEEANDVVLFYFSGHGQQDSSGEYTIWPSNTSISSNENEIQSAMLGSWLRCLESSQQIVIIDSCNSGGFIKELFYYGRVILASCCQDEDSYEKRILGHSIFTNFFLDAFNNLIDVDANNDNGISIQEVFNWVELKTTSFAKSQFLSQNPKMSSTNNTQIRLMDLVRYNRQVTHYITLFITFFAISFSLITWNRYLSLVKKS